LSFENQPNQILEKLSSSYKTRDQSGSKYTKFIPVAVVEKSRGQTDKIRIKTFNKKRIITY